MKVIILAGGLGTRISEYTKSIPKPMIKINNLPILVHIMEHFARFGLKDFLIATGYKGKVIEKYFIKNKYTDWNVEVVPTGKNVMTGGRLKRLQKKLQYEENFFDIRRWFIKHKSQKINTFPYKAQKNCHFVSSQASSKIWIY